MPLRARLDVPGTLHHLIVRGIEKRRIVDDVADRKNFVKRSGQLSMELVKTQGIALAEVTRQVGVSTSAVSKIISRAC